MKNGGTSGAIRSRELGARPVEDGTAFAVRSATAEAIELCFDTGSRVAMTRGDDDIWRITAAGITHGQRYGYRAYGQHDPKHGLHFDPEILLLDPYAEAIDGEWSVVVDDCFDWGDDAAPRTSLRDSVIYEAHVRGISQLHPDVPPSLRGTYAGLAHPAVISELTSLGITAIELLPVHENRTESSIADRGLVNYWGYSTVGFLAPHGAYAAAGSRGGQVAEFKAMVKALHAAGIEVILDVVYNHTAEGGPDGPSLCFRGLDNPAYYWLDPNDPSSYVNVTGCGNTLDPLSETVQALVLDSLRHFVTEYHIDGFRFDLAVTLGRERAGFTPDAPLLLALQNDPLLSDVKLIAEPWDVGLGGYQVGHFPAAFAEWNGIYRDTVRDAWRTQSDRAELVRMLAGSSDLFRARGPWASVNFITAHDGFSLADLVAYNEKHNEANREGNRDGDSHNRSWNSGAEGPTDDAAINDLRDRRARGILATLLLSIGVPMLTAGDERGRTQQGNNNTYCQDSRLSWFDWELDDRQATLLACTQRLIALRRDEPLLRRDVHLAEGDVDWLAGDGTQVDDPRWHNASERALGMHLQGTRGFLVLVNTGPSEVAFLLPDGAWVPLVDTAQPDGAPASDTPVSGLWTLAAWAVVALRAG